MMGILDISEGLPSCGPKGPHSLTTPPGPGFVAGPG